MKFFYFFGFILWLIATLIFQIAGHYILVPNVLILMMTFLVTIPLIITVTFPLYKFKKVDNDDVMKAAVSIALPGMLLDIISFLNFGAVFPNLPANGSIYFGAWLLFAYSLILMTGFIKISTDKKA
ncbi:DUF5367 family protein [Metabacillus fastidiosus]|uniref:DUF5367 family protein n=1 Tax=Metabacillus fastidiosus TaxID=1458 RepID=UPI002DBFC41A|nr:DUF5367 family protein [Metabacillus fastidiosus]MEC2075281.1 DUF5367 family protein [Metabacillus fastidiosus]